MCDCYGDILYIAAGAIRLSMQSLIHWYTDWLPVLQLNPPHVLWSVAKLIDGIAIFLKCELRLLIFGNWVAVEDSYLRAIYRKPCIQVLVERCGFIKHCRHMNSPPPAQPPVALAAQPAPPVQPPAPPIPISAALPQGVKKRIQILAIR
jgi:hypothetical protein